MTKKGYTHIIVPTELHHTLKKMSKQRNVSISKLIEQSINTSINTRQEKASTDLSDSFIKEAQTEPISHNGFSVNAFPKRVEWGEGDLNPRPPAPQAGIIDQIVRPKAGIIEGSAQWTLDDHPTVAALGLSAISQML